MSRSGKEPNPNSLHLAVSIKARWDVAVYVVLYLQIVMTRNKTTTGVHMMDAEGGGDGTVIGHGKLYKNQITTDRDEDGWCVENVTMKQRREGRDPARIRI